MNSPGLTTLYRVLKKPIGSHLDDEILAEVVEAELAGENIEQQYQEQLAHIESCESCAGAYSELLLLMQGIVGDMAESAESTNTITSIWSRALSATAELLENKFRLTFSPPALHLAEPAPEYGTPGERLLTRQEIPGPDPLTLEVRLARQTALTCRILVQIQDAKGDNLPGRQIQLRFGPVTRTAESTAIGPTGFDNIPLAALPGLELTAEP